MLRKMMLAGLMTATVLGGIAPAYAQRGDDNGWRGRGGERSGRPDGGRGGQGNGQAQRQDGGEMRQQQAQRWEQRQAERPAPVAQPQARPDRQWRGNEARPEQRGPDTVTRWNRGERRFETTVRGDDRNDRNWNDRDRDRNRQGWQDNRRDDDRRDRDWRDRDRRDDRNDRRWSNDDRRWNGGNPGWNSGRRFDDRNRWEGQRRWDSGWRNDRRYDWSSYRSRYGDRYRMGRYYAPRGWSYGYSRYSIGIFLNSLLYSNSYWIDDPYSYRLPPAYGTLRWVRYYDDALLVDIRDGYVVDVIYDFFW
ncbi:MULTISPECIES: RcnB family protein [unclassified Sphingobium]|uniref:RcnB family protein n=1 Tax=unclassified Sphingobium TaxID=2611147 RepID=UPI000829F974|nr:MULTISPECIES: RcnB family protein [unclassified Sphingobium]